MRPNHNRNLGSALVIILAMVVLVSVLALTFYVHADLSRQISFSTAAQYRASQLGTIACDTIVGDLRNEMAAGSTVYTSNGFAVYIPTTNMNAVPMRVGDRGLTNLVKASVSLSNFWSGATYSTAGPIRSLANNSTTNPSANGRRIEISRWNSHYLFGETAPASMPAPDWVLVTRGGVISNVSAAPSLAAMANPATANPDFIIGRFAYMIFDEGGLLDINVAGYPSGVPQEYTSRRGTLPQVDLDKIPGIADASGLVKWRNAQTASSPATYTNAVLVNSNGFSAVAPGDQTFVSRQDLIKYVRAHSAQVPLNSLQYLATFTRETNAPSYSPKADRAKVQASENPATYGMEDDFNPGLVNLRGTNGVPYFNKRFPLGRLALVSNSATGDSSSDIYKCFGLTRGSASSPWQYGHGASGRILRLSEVAALGRQPDFFEMLQGAINVGSLGKAGANTFADNDSYDKNVYYQILQIGANLIDQYDADSYPTRIAFDSTEISGVENLPYLAQVYETAYRPFAGGVASQRDKLGMWYQPVIWNPHGTAATLASAPTRFRFISSGDAYVYFHGNGWSAVSTAQDLAAAGGIEFFNRPEFSEPQLLTPAIGASASGVNSVSDGVNQFVGINIGTASAPDKKIDPSVPSEYTWAVAEPQPFVTHELQYWDGGQWVTYCEMKNIQSQAASMDNGTAFADYRPVCFEVRSDPRTDRFGVYGSFDNPNYRNSETVRPAATDGYQTHAGPVARPGWVFGGSQPYAPNFISAYAGTLSDNTSASATRYLDPDGVLRKADGAYASGSSLDGRPLAAGNLPSRPVVLNRPFRSVADMGYASRGVPWKSLDFFTAESGDAALLDVFSINDAPTDTPMSGRLNLNTRQIPVLSAALAGAIKSENDATVIADADASAIATALVDLTTSQGPLENRSDLATRLGPKLSYSSTADSVIKRRREAAIRALADIGNTRTWVLLIDIIAQTGKVSPRASSVNDFIVEGEQHFWLHVAIDRYTGKVIGRQLEAVNE